SYVALTLFCMAAYALAGMGPLDAVAHALSTISTAGFSTADASLAHWDSPAIQWIAIVGMLAGSVPFVLYVRLLRRDLAILRDSQVRVFLGLTGMVVLLLALWLAVSGRYGPTDALRHAALSVVSILTTTGFASADYTAWGGA